MPTNTGAQISSTPTSAEEQYHIFRHRVLIVLLLILVVLLAARSCRNTPVPIPEQITPTPSPTPTEITPSPSPTSSVTPTKTHTQTPSPSPTPSPTGTPSPSSTPSPSLTPTSGQRRICNNHGRDEGAVWVVAGCDTLTFIAQQTGISLPSLLQANPEINDPDLIYPNQRIILPGR